LIGCGYDPVIVLLSIQNPPFLSTYYSFPHNPYYLIYILSQWWESTGIGGVREQAGSFWVHDEGMLPELLCNPNYSVKFLIEL
jgi:hypothetical protein